MFLKLLIKIFVLSLGTTFVSVSFAETQGGHCITCERLAHPHNSKNMDGIQAVSRELNHRFPSFHWSDRSRNLRGPTEPLFDWSAFPEVTKYTNSKQVQGMLNLTNRVRNAWNPLASRCYHAVKSFLYKSHLIGHTLTGSSVFPKQFEGKIHVGKDAISDMKPEFINMLDNPTYRAILTNPAAAPVGAILIYEGGHRLNAGHSEIRTKDGFVSDHFDKRDVITVDNQNNYHQKHRLVGVMIRSETL